MEVGCKKLLRAIEHIDSCYDAILVIAPRSMSAKALFNGPTFKGTPVSFLFADCPDDLRDWLRSSILMNCKPSVWSIVSAKPEVFRKESNKLKRALSKCNSRARQVVTWNPDQITRDEFLEKMRCGPDLVVYRGHAGRKYLDCFHGIDIDDLTRAESSSPCGLFLALTCSTLAGRGVTNLGGAWVASGRCCCFFGAIGEVQAKDNRILAELFVKCLCKRQAPGLLSDLISEMEAESLKYDCNDAFQKYRLVGDPLVVL